MQLINGEQMPVRTLQTASVFNCYAKCFEMNGDQRCPSFEFNSNTRLCRVYYKTTLRDKRTSTGTNIYVEGGSMSGKLNSFYCGPIWLKNVVFLNLT